jgi:hypothetical protein
VKAEADGRRVLRELAGSDAVYEQSDVVELTRVSKASLQNWVNRQIIRPADARPGKARNRKYSSFDIALVALTDGLVRIGVELHAAAQMAEISVLLILKEISERGIGNVERYLRDYLTLWEPRGRREYNGDLFKRSEISKRYFDSGPYVLLPVGQMVADLIESIVMREARRRRGRKKGGRGAKSVSAR